MIQNPLIIDAQVDIMQLLKVETLVEHETTEKLAYARPIKSGTLTTQQYWDLLTKNWYIHQKLEQIFMESAFNEPIIRQFLQTKSDWLLQDLTIIPKAICLPPINFQSKSSLLGGLYVVEGSMLGGQYIVKMLSKNKHLKNIKHFYFFSGKKDSTRERWLSLRTLLKNEIVTTQGRREAVEGAKRTFQFFQQVYRLKLN